MPHLQDLGTSGTLPPLLQNCYTPGFFCPKNCSDAGILGNRGTWVNGQTGLEFSGVVNGQTDGKRTNGLRNFLCNYHCQCQRNRVPESNRKTMKSAAGKRPPDMTHSAPKKKLSSRIDCTAPNSKSQINFVKCFRNFAVYVQKLTYLMQLLSTIHQV